MRGLVKTGVVLVLDALAEQLQLLQELGLGDATRLFLFKQLFQLLCQLVEERGVFVLTGDDGVFQLVFHHQGSATGAGQLL
ncbi:hypothetical protein D3C84_999070 [compost metagenome]